MAVESGSAKDRPAGIIRALVIVARDRPDLLPSLTRHFAANEDVRVLLDRRQGARRQRVQPCDLDRRGSDRRHPPSIEWDVGHRPYVIARPQP
jgi:hypothetical protein